MTFNELLNTYMKQVACTGKELSERSGLSCSLISRYRSGEREPQTNSQSLLALADALAAIAMEKHLPQMSSDSILSAFEQTLSSKNRRYELFLRRFQLLYDQMHLNMKGLAAFTNFDTSSLYRIKSGERKASNLPFFCDQLAKYLIHTYSSEEHKQRIAKLLSVEPDALSTPNSYYQTVLQWLLTDETAADVSQEKPLHDVSQLLTMIDTFDLEDYIRVIHFDKLKVPTLPLHLPSTKNYYGIEKMREGELDFFKMTVTSRTTEPIFMCSDMPMLDMAGSNDFNKKWMFAIACAIKKGLHLNMIHSLDRPFDELLLGLEAWIPIYMTGQVSPYYLPKANNPIYHHLNYVSGVASLCGESIEGAPLDGKYTLTNNKEELAYFQKKAKQILAHAKPLMEIYDQRRQREFQQFLQTDATIAGDRKHILSSFPIYTMSEELLIRILAHNNIAPDAAEQIQNYRRSEIERIQQTLDHSDVIVEAELPSAENYDKHPMSVCLSGCFYPEPGIYSYEEMLEHFEETKAFANAQAHYRFETTTTSAFRNIQIEIVKDRYVRISKIKSPSIHFVIRHPKLVHALQHFTTPVIETA